MTDTREAAVVTHGRLEYIDAIRGVAAFVVAVSHAVDAWYPSFQAWSIGAVNLGRVGIVAFFVVSGYVVGMTLSKQTPRTFVVRRLWRLYPVYWLATAVFILALITTQEVTPDFSLFVILINLTMAQGFIGTQSILGVAWTLGIELAFYAQATFAKVLGRLPAVAIVGWFWLGMFAAMALSNYYAGSHYSAVMPLMMFTASMGYALYLWEAQRRRLVLAQLVAAVLLVPILSWFLSANQQTTAFTVWPPVGFSASYLVGLGLFAVFYAVRNRRSHNWLLWLGATSYALYLFHTTVIMVVKGTEVPATVGIPVSLVASALIGGAVHSWIERRAINEGRRRTTHVAGSRTQEP